MNKLTCDLYYGKLCTIVMDRVTDIVIEINISLGILKTKRFFLNLKRDMEAME